MATLVLTVVGSVLGGPIGGAIGGLLGQTIDRDVLFRPKGRDGPRLTDLSVQTSSYGAPIARVYGTMRVAGSVIWSTDLIETRSTSSAGKGQPTVTNYSYSASFAVLLSGRPVVGVGRIWADGNLLRGAAGDFKSQTDFRLHLGDEDQPVDPLIAAAEGVTLTPALRGAAYAVFEGFQLADYGNRIPSLTFELIADAAPVTIGAVAADLGGGVVTDAGVDTKLLGFSAYGDSARGVLDLLAQASDAWFAPLGSMLAIRNDRVAVQTLDDAGYAAQGAREARGSRRVRRRAPIESVAQTLTLAHYDPARDYQTGLQRARRPGAGTATSRIDLPAAIEATAARAMAEQALASAEAAREQRSLALSWSSIELVPGVPVSIAGEAGLWRVDGWSLEAMVLTLDLVRLAKPAQASADTIVTSGRVLSSPDVIAGTTLLQAFELPALDDMPLQAPRLLIAAAGTEPGWRRAALLLSTDGGARYEGLGATALPAVIGTIMSPPGVASAALVDRTNTIDVDLAHPAMVLHGADDIMLDGGANLALLGGELIQFGAATPLGPKRWRLARLWRGRRGTEVAIGTQAVGDRFVLLDKDALVAADLPPGTIGGTAIVLASGLGDRAGPVRADTAISGASLLPPSPVQLAAMRQADGTVLVRWARRSRIGWRWTDGVDVPLGEEREAYRIVVEPPGAPSSTIDSDLPALVIDAALAPVGTRITVRQVGTAGESGPATYMLAN